MRNGTLGGAPRLSAVPAAPACPQVVVLLIGTNDLGAVAWEAGGPWEAEVALFRAVPGVTLRCAQRQQRWPQACRRPLAEDVSFRAPSCAGPPVLTDAGPPACCAPPPPPRRACRVLQTLHALRDALPDTHVVLLALLPRGGGPTGYRWPSLFTQPFEVVNAHFRCGLGLGLGLALGRGWMASCASAVLLVPSQPTALARLPALSPPSLTSAILPRLPGRRDYTRLDGHLHFLDCGDRFLAPDGRSIRAE